MRGVGQVVSVDDAQRVSRAADKSVTVGGFLCVAVGLYLDVACTRGAMHPARPASLFKLVRKVVQEGAMPDGMNGD